jgi:hypothetical protein
VTARSRFRRPGLRALLLLAAIGAFSVGYSILAENDLWPRLRPGALHDTDLVAGFAGVAGLLVLLVAEGRRRPARGGKETEREAAEPGKGGLSAGSGGVSSSNSGEAAELR